MRDLTDLLDTYLAQLQAQGQAPTTLNLRRHQLESALAFLRRQGVLRAANITAADLDAWLIYLSQKKGWAPGSIRGARGAMSRFGAWLTQRGKVLTNPAADLEPTSVGSQPLPPPPLTKEQVDALLEAVPRHEVLSLRNAAQLDLIYSCGLRLEESLGLNLDDLDRDRCLVLVRGKGGHERLLPVQPRTLATLNDYLALRRTLLQGPDHGALFLNYNGERLHKASFWRWLRGHAERVLGPEVKVHPHLLRHSIAVHLLRAGVDVRHLQEFLGHADLDMTKVYLRLVPEHLREDYDRAMPVLA